jgi:hypothetical protein
LFALKKLKPTDNTADVPWEIPSFMHIYLQHALRMMRTRDLPLLPENSLRTAQH